MEFVKLVKLDLYLKTVMNVKLVANILALVKLVVILRLVHSVKQTTTFTLNVQAANQLVKYVTIKTEFLTAQLV